jgi:hypothetical protein
VKGLLQLLTAPTAAPGSVITGLPATTEAMNFQQLLESAKGNAAAIERNLQTGTEFTSTALSDVSCTSVANSDSELTHRDDSKTRTQASKLITAEGAGKNSAKAKSATRSSKTEASADSTSVAAQATSTLRLPCHTAATLRYQHTHLA